MPRSSSSDTLVVGRGLAGLALAADLRRQGREPTVVEQAPEWRASGYGIGLWPEGLSVLDELGALPAARARATVPDGFGVRSADVRVRDLWFKFDEAPDLSVGVLGAQVSVTARGGGPFRSAVGVDDTAAGDDATSESFVRCITRDGNGRGRDDLDTDTADVKFHETARRLPKGKRDSILETVDSLEEHPVTALTALL